VSTTLEKIIELVSRRQVFISSHGYDELAADDILVKDMVIGIAKTVVVEDYPDYHKGPCVLVLQKIARASPSMWSGVYRKENHHRQFSLQHTDPTLRDGPFNF
jgi:hypothetical protein